MDDAISRQAVLKLLSTMPPEEATTKALLIQSVKQMDAPDNLVKDSQGLAKDLVNDCISRQAAIDAVKKNTFRLTFAEEQNCEGHVAWSAEAVYSDVMEGALLELPSAQPERKRGKWIDYANSHCECSVCHTEWSYFQNEVECFEFCPNCGADMRGEQDE